MALEFTEYGKNLVLRNMFGKGRYNFNQSNSSEDVGANSAPTLAGVAGNNPGAAGKQTSGHLYIQFYGGTRPDISTVSRAWQASAYSGSTKLWPTSTTNALAASTSFFNNVDSNTSTGQPTTAVTIDWDTNTVTTSAASIASNLLFNQGTVTWFAIYGSFGRGSRGATNILDTTISNYFLVMTGTVGATGSGADIEINRTDIPSNSYPVQIKKLSFKFPQPTGVDLIFNKHIYATTMTNILGAGTSFNSTFGQYVNGLTTTGHANAKYVFGSTANLVNLYTGTRPANPEAAVPGDATLIASVNVGELSYPNMTFVNTASETSLTKTGNAFGTAVATGNPTWCRIMSSTSGGYAALDCSAGLPGSGAAVIYQDAITSGMTVNLTSLKFSMA